MKVGGCDGKVDTRCATVDDFKGSVTTGTDCTCNSVVVDETEYKSSTSWFFNVQDKDGQEGVFATPLQVNAPFEGMSNDTKDKAFTDQPGLMLSGDKLPARVAITSTGTDGWCASRVCIGSQKWGKKYVWEGNQWMNPGDTGPCAKNAWDYLELKIEDGFDCGGVEWPPTSAPTAAPTAAPVSTNGDEVADLYCSKVLSKGNIVIDENAGTASVNEEFETSAQAMNACVSTNGHINKQQTKANRRRCGGVSKQDCATGRWKLCDGAQAQSGYGGRRRADRKLEMVSQSGACAVGLPDNAPLPEAVVDATAPKE